MKPPSEKRAPGEADQLLGQVATAPAASPPIDYAALLERLGNDEDLLRAVVPLFLEDCPPRLSAIESAVRARDAVKIRSEAHGLRGAAGNLAAIGLSEAAQVLELIGAEGRIDAADHAWLRLKAEAAAALDYFRTLQHTWR